MVRIVTRPGSSVRSVSGNTAPTTASGTALGSGPSIVNKTSILNNYAPGSSINRLNVPGVAPATSTSASASTNYKLSVASMLLAMKNQALGSLSLGGSKAGGSITENYSGINLG